MVTRKRKRISKRAFVAWCHAQNPDFVEEALPSLISFLEADEESADLTALDRLSLDEISRLREKDRRELLENLRPDLERWLLGPILARCRQHRVLEKWPNLQAFCDYPRLGKLYYAVVELLELWSKQRLAEQAQQPPRDRCGRVERFRERSAEQAVEAWDLLQSGLKPAGIARRLYPEMRTPSGRPRRAALMRVGRALERIYVLIYGTRLPQDRRRRQLAGFDLRWHEATCAPCRRATSVKQMCKRAQAYYEQDSVVGPHPSGNDTTAVAVADRRTAAAFFSTKSRS